MKKPGTSYNAGESVDVVDPSNGSPWTGAAPLGLKKAATANFYDFDKWGGASWSYNSLRNSGYYAPVPENATGLTPLPARTALAYMGDGDWDMKTGPIGAEVFKNDGVSTSSFPSYVKRASQQTDDGYWRVKVNSNGTMGYEWKNRAATSSRSTPTSTPRRIRTAPRRWTSPTASSSRA